MTEPPPDADFAQVKACFEAVCDLPDEAARRARLDELGASPEQIRRVLALLDQDRTLTHGLGVPITGMLASLEEPELAIGDRLGPWTLRSELGRGGMGRVMLAERSDGLYEQRAAIKLLRGFSGEAALAQLAHERQVLAKLNHPHIARLLDGGTTPAGRPYLVMEHVKGDPLDRYCRDRRLDLEAVLTLFEQVCSAVSYAHRQLVVHCDIKPGNVLVGEDGHAMLLDFGVAQLLGKTGQVSTSLTPRYASPEQMAGLNATSASDVFSLGRTLDQLLHAIRPPAPRADEWQAIVAKATALDPEQRYDGVPALLRDLRHFRQHLPLAARPRSTRYRLRKLVRRRWPWVLAGCGVLVLSAAFVAQLVVERDRALQAEALAEQEAATTRQVSDFIVALFEGADPNVAGRPDLSAAELVDKGRERIDRDLQGQLALQADMKGVLAKVYENIGRPRTAVELYEQAVALEREQSPRRPLREAAMLSRLAVVLANEHQATRAVAAARESLTLRQPRLPADAPELSDSLNSLGLALAMNGAFDEALDLLQQALKIRLLRQESAPLEVASVRHNLALVHARAGRHELAVDQYRDALAIKLRTLGKLHPSVLNTQSANAVALANLQRFDEALVMQRELVVARRQLHGPRSAKVSGALNEVASVLQDAGRLEEAVATYQEALALDEQISGRKSIDVAVRLNNLATALEDLGDPAAEALYRESLLIRRALLAPGDLSVARVEHNLARWLVRAGRRAEAGPLLDSSGQTRRSKLPASHNEAADADILRAEWLVTGGQLDAAEKLLAGLKAQEAALNPTRRATLWRAQALLAHARGNGAAAVDLQRRALQGMLDRGSPLNPRLLLLQVELAELQAANGQPAAARQTLVSQQTRLAAQHPASALARRSQALLQRLRAG
ncbi:MAG: tetratricopeptide repeat protein [Rubrivivax sp.]|nr:tetratricopeptide repeat protein [Rubrivivax sp.]